MNHACSSTLTCFFLPFQIHLNPLDTQLLYDVPSFKRELKNNLVLLPESTWDGNVAKRYELVVKKSSTSVKKLSPDGTEKEKKKKSTTLTATGEKKKKSPSKTKTSVTPPSDEATAADGTATPTSTTPTKSSTKIIKKKKETVVEPVPETVVEPVPEPVAAPAPAAVELPPIELIKVDETEQPTLPQQQNRILTSPVDDAPSELFNVSPVSDVEQLSDDDLALGASASPTLMGPAYEFGNAGPTEADLLGASTETGGDSNDKTKGDKQGDLDFSNFLSRKFGGDEAPTWQHRVNTSAADFVSAANTEKETYRNGGPRGYVGLVNQAMTCYLNSLLQALYMTPEFRNALYRWEFDNDNEAKNIPYQLQKLFLNLQTSPKSSVETTDLTRSFGWDSTEAWQQHDIQELCRVMFDALEHKFKNTKQANLISNLYEGKMNDYVKCLECNTEKTREDTFLDIPLPVRPFGSSTAYGSIEEALCAFVQPETLDGNNQYLCEKCKKKCDAHKGLHFKSFPYILTLHLKRFDFDYQTMHRIKLNDR